MLMITGFRLIGLSILASVSMQTLNDSEFRSLKDHSSEEKSIDCSPPNYHRFKKGKEFSHVPILPGWGHHHYPISTKSDSAQLYFDQGLSMYYSYHPDEAEASFRESAKLDPKCAMAYWGMALSNGPVYNSTAYYLDQSTVDVLKRLKSADLNASSKEMELIQAIIERYSTFKLRDARIEMDDQYAYSMKELVGKYPEDFEIKALYVDAVMLRHAWDFWDGEGMPKEWTPELLDLCRQILHKDSVHPGGLHYQIHLCEASRHPELALHSADVLKEAMPGVAHMVHMTSHTYERNALYEEAIEMNEKAIALGGGGNLHYRAVETVAAMNAGNYKKAMELASICRDAFSSPSSTNSAQYFLFPTFVQIRFGKWDQILETSPSGSSSYASIMIAFAKGLASVRNNRVTSAKSYLDQIRALSTNSELQSPDLPLHDSPIKAVQVAYKILEGEIFASEKKIDSASSSFLEAIRNEDEMVFYQPRNWLIPARQFFGAFLLTNGKTGAAQTCYEEDLIRNPGNGWSMVGLYQCLTRRGESNKAKAYQRKYMLVFANAEQIPDASVY